MKPARKLLVGSAACAVLLLWLVAQAAAQPFALTFDAGWNGVGVPPLPAAGFWDVQANWNNNFQAGTSNNVSPYAYYQETAIIGGDLLNSVGDLIATFAPVTVNVRTFQDTLGTSAASPAANRRAVAGVLVQNGSTLNIQSTGRLSVLVTYGADGATTGLPTPGTGSVAVESGGMITIQSSGQLNVVDNIDINNGSMTVFPGGVVTAQSINSGAAGTIALSGNASLTSTGSTTLNGTTTISGPNVVFNSAQVFMGDSTVFNPVITGGTHSIMNVNGPVTMNGTLRPQITGVTPTLGSSWVLWDSTSTDGQFDFSDDSLTDLPDPGHRYNVATTTVGSVNGTRGLLIVENFLTIEVNRANGEVRLRNTANTGGVNIDGYQISSASGSIDPAGFTSSLDDDNFDGGAWVETNLTANSVAELNNTAGGSSLIATSTNNLLGSIYDPVPTLQQFGDPVPEDFVFTYRRSDGRLVNGAVTYINDGVDNTLVLQVDPSDGKARIVNDSPFDDIKFDGYRILSDNMLLNPAFTSLSDQAIGGWVEAAVSDTVLSELNMNQTGTPNDGIVVDAGQTAAVFQNLFNFTSMAERDLVFEFRVPGMGTLTGEVEYVSFSLAGVPGDYNNDGRVDGGDYVRWRNHLGDPNENNINNNGDGGGVTISDYAFWKVRYGNPGAGGGGINHVPEPSSLLAATVLVCLLIAFARVPVFPFHSRGKLVPVFTC